MNSTDEKRLRTFFDKRLSPAAAQIRARKVTFFALGPDEPQPALAAAPESHEDSWYVAPPTEPQLFRREGRELTENLTSLWSKQQLPELVELAEPLAELAKQLEPQEQQAEDISPFVYVLY